ncbi:hypothetical protein [Dialister succinatiphilus]|uniref:hypothetical protein n=1 Tax=Dialister succinatiphilus TaxID=487173 RepID=UPI004026419E
MKKIIISSVLAIISLMVGTFSFIINDLPAYHRWMADNGPRMMENFDRWGKDRKDTKKMPSNDRLREDRKDHHDRNGMDQDRKDLPDNRQDRQKDAKGPDKE